MLAPPRDFATRVLAEAGPDAAHEPPAPEARSTIGAMMRWEAKLGDTFEAALAERIGPDRAYELRAGGGWSQSRTTWSGRCAE